MILKKKQQQQQQKKEPADSCRYHESTAGIISHHAGFVDQLEIQIYILATPSLSFFWQSIFMTKAPSSV